MRPLTTAVAAVVISISALVARAAGSSADAAGSGVVRVKVICDGLGQATVELSAARPNGGDARLVGGGGVRLVTPLPIVATDRRTGAVVRTGTSPRDAIPCTPFGFSGLRFSDGTPTGTAPPPGVSAGDILDGRMLISVIVEARPAQRAAASTLPLFPYDAALRSYLLTRSDVGAIALFDRQNGTTFGYFPTRSFITASIVKADILATLLHKGSLTDHQKALAKLMIEQSDNAAATELWWDAGGGPGVAAFNRLVPMPSTTMGSGGYWALTQTTPPDQVALVRTIAYPSSLLSPQAQEYELSLMRGVIPSQKWGVSAGVPSGAAVALKNGWFLAAGTWHINSIGHISGGGLDYAIAILTTNNPSQAYGIDTVEALSRLIVGQLPRPAPSVTSGSDDSLDLARRTSGGEVEHLTWSGGTWSQPESLGGDLIGAPSLVAVPGGLDLFDRGSGGNVSWRHEAAGQWSSWERVPGQEQGWEVSSPAAVAGADGSVRLFVRGRDGGLWTDLLDPNGTWAGWKRLDAALDSGPAACMSADGTVTVAEVGADDHFWTGTLNGDSWSGWKLRTGLLLDADPAVVCDAAGVELFARGVDHALWTRTLTGSWKKLDGSLQSQPSVTVRGQSIEVLAQFTDGQTHRKIRDASGLWSNWKLVTPAG